MTAVISACMFFIYRKQEKKQLFQHIKGKNTAQMPKKISAVYDKAKLNNHVSKVGISG